jgi:hypothetical protein
MNVNDTLTQAILAKKPCIIAKPGEPARKICPYRLGKSGKGEQNIIYYQHDGYTSRAGGLQPDGSTENWRCNHVADTGTAEIINEPWHEPVQKPKARGKCVVYDYVEVNYYD